MQRQYQFIFVIWGLFLLNACAGTVPVPGGSEAANDDCFSSIADMQYRLAEMMPGILEEQALKKLCRTKDGLQRLERRDIRLALMGGENIPFPNAYKIDGQDPIPALYGYKLNFKSIKREHGFTSPIRIRTDEAGFNYSVTLIFKGGKLFEKPIVAGGVVNGSSSGTLFDFITPGTIINHAIP
jgi:hypothetical protein